MKITDELYRLAFEYRAAKPWRMLFDDNLFAIRLSNGEIGYVSIMGFYGEYCALGLYIGDRGGSCLAEIMSNSHKKYRNYFEFKETFIKQVCLQCIFVCKDELSPEELKDVRAYAKPNGIRFRGKNAFPQFLKFQPNHMPWKLETEDEQQYLCEAIGAALRYADFVSKNCNVEFFTNMSVSNSIPLIEPDVDISSAKRTDMPKLIQCQHAQPRFGNDIAAAKLNGMKKSGVIDCDVLRLPSAVQSPTGGAPVFPVMLMAVDEKTDQVIPCGAVASFDDDPSELLNTFAHSLIECKRCPSKIRVEDERTYAFLKKFCERLNIKLELCEKLPALRSAEDDFADFIDPLSDDDCETQEQMMDLLEAILEDCGDNLPPNILSIINNAAENGYLSDDDMAEIQNFLGSLY